jgi:hypothetical protein
MAGTYSYHSALKDWLIVNFALSDSKKVQFRLNNHKTTFPQLNIMAKFLKLSGTPLPGGAVGPFSGGGGLAHCKRGIYFELIISAGWNIYFDMHLAWLKCFTYHLVPVLSPNYTQHILSSNKVRHVCYSLAKLYVICLFAFIRVEGALRSWNFVMKGCYKSLGIYKISPSLLPCNHDVN